MRVWQIGDRPGPSHLRLAEAPDPICGDRDVVIDTHAVALNYRDLLVVNGRYARTLATGAVPCSDVAGTVVATGARVTQVRVGARVTSTFVPDWIDGSYRRAVMTSALGSGTRPGVLAEHVVLPEEAVVPVPGDLASREAATLPCAALTAWHALFEERVLPPGATVLALGSGGVSLFALAFARAAGYRVAMTTSRADKVDRLRALGADAVIDTHGIAAWGDAARAWSGGEGVDCVIEVGGTGTLDQSLRAVRPGGLVCLIGNVAPEGPVNLMPVLMRNICVQGVVVGSRAMFLRMNAAIDRWRIRPVVDRVFPFDDAPAAFAYLGQQDHVGKVVIERAHRG